MEPKLLSKDKYYIGNAQGIKRSIGDSDHVCLVRVKIPTKLSEKQRQIFQELAKEEEPTKDEEYSD